MKHYSFFMEKRKNLDGKAYYVFPNQLWSNYGQSLDQTFACFERGKAYTTEIHLLAEINVYFKAEGFLS